MTVVISKSLGEDHLTKDTNWSWTKARLELCWWQRKYLESETVLIIIFSGKYTSSNCQVGLYSTIVTQFLIDGKVWGIIPEQFFQHSQVLLFPPGSSDLVFITSVLSLFSWTRAKLPTWACGLWRIQDSSQCQIGSTCLHWPWSCEQTPVPDPMHPRIGFSAITLIFKISVDPHI